MKNTPSSVLLKPSEVCEILKCSRRTLYRIRQDMAIPFFKVRGRVMYKLKDVEAYIESCKETA
ncbi:helix-turn-helix domain-containing protein [Phaeodactylibacter xiamenensis]|uniref:helix-turn-helix domain-containing protein n=1 Tax=Phaeodactylibacter xiamenensis TaxID=1524460 RepID=UPI003BA9380C